MLTYNATTLALTGVLNTTPNSTPSEGGGLGGIWSGGDSVVSDGLGDFYFMTGNGSFDQDPSNFPNGAALSTSTGNPGLPIDGDYGDSFVKVQADTVHDSPTNQNVNGWGLQVVDYFTPIDQNVLQAADEDLGSGGPTLLPDSLGTPSDPHLMVGGGKEGKVYLINRGTDNSVMTMGQFHTNTDDVVQEVANAANGILSTPAYFNGNIYVTSGYNNAPMYELSINDVNGTPELAQVASNGQTPDDYGNLDGSPMVSANGTANGIVWNLARNASQLRAYSAADLGDEIYNSSTLSSDALPSGSVLKFSVPTVVNGDATWARATPS